MNIILLIIRKASILTGALFFWITSIVAQEPLDSGNVILTDTIANEEFMYKNAISVHRDSIFSIDSIAQPDIILKKYKRKEKYYSPKKATIYSAVLPGLGQAYNGKFWKIPIIYIGGGLLYWGYYTNNDIYLEARRLLIEENKKESPEQYRIDYYKNAMNSYSKNSGYFIIGLGLLYVANVIDAMADAYFNSFDISDDLTLRIDPVVVPPPNLAINGGYTYGLKLSLNLR